MKIRHAHTNIYEVTDPNGDVIWFRGTWKECQKYMKKENAKNKKQ
jgi:hypothetical protein